MKRKVFYNHVECYMLDASQCTAGDVRIAVAMMNGKSLDELTLADYEASQKAWISAMIRMLPASYMRKQSHHLQAVLRILNEEILKPLRSEKRKRGRPRKSL